MGRGWEKEKEQATMKKSASLTCPVHSKSWNTAVALRASTGRAEDVEFPSSSRMTSTDSTFKVSCTQGRRQRDSVGGDCAESTALSFRCKFYVEGDDAYVLTTSPFTSVETALGVLCNFTA